MAHIVGTVPQDAGEPTRRAGPAVPWRALDRLGSAPAWVPALVVGVLALAVELVGVAGPSLWTDEAVTLSAARMSWGDLWAFLQTVDAVHGVYYAAMKPWLTLVGGTALALRIPSAVAVAVAASLVFLLGRRLAGPGTGLLGAAVLALLPRVTWAAVEGRSYAATVGLAAAATLLAVRLAERPSVLRALPYAGLLAVGAWVNADLLLLVPAHVVAVAAREGWRGRALAMVTAAGAAAGLTTLPLLRIMSGQEGQLGTPSWSPVALLRTVVVNQYFLGETPTPTTAATPALTSSAWTVSAVVLTGGTVLVVGWALASRPWGRGLHRPEAAIWVWGLSWVVVPTAVLLGAALLRPGLYNPRYLTFTSGGCALVLAAALLALAHRHRRVAVAALVVLALAVVPVFVSQRTEYAKSSSDWSEVATYLAVHAHAGDGVYYGPVYPAQDPVRGQTLRPIADAYPADVSALVDVTLRSTPAEDHTLAGTSFTVAESPRLAGVDVVWVVTRRGVDDRADLQALGDAGFTPGTEQWSGPLTDVRRYARSGR